MRINLIILLIFVSVLSYANNTIIDSLKKVVQSVFNDHEKIKACIEISELYSKTDFEKSLQYSKQAYHLARKAQDIEGLAYALNNIGVLYYYKGEYKNALKYYFNTLKLDKQLENDSMHATHLSNIGMVYCDLGEYDLAVEYYKKALELDKKTGNKSNVPIRLNNIAMIYTLRGNYKKALEYFQQALEIDREMHNEEPIGIRLNNIGMIFLYMHEYYNAIEYFNQALQIDKKINNKQNVAIRLNNLGRAFNGLKKYDKAKKYYNQALELNQSLNNQVDIAIGMKNIGETYLATGNYSEALSYFNKAMQINKELGKKYEISTIYQLMGKLYLAKNNLDSALFYIRKSNILAQELNMLPQLVDNYKILINLFDDMDISDSSFFYYKEYVSLKDSIYNEDVTLKLNDLQKKYENEKRKKEIALLYRDKLLNQSKIERQRTLIYILVLIFIILTVIFITVYIYRRNKNMQSRNQLKEELNKYMQKALRQQMNPHFIFNTLTSIQYYILKNDNVASNKYLTKFAKLMRMTLDNSQHNTVSVEEEIETLKLYLELESLRFESKFEYIIEVQSNDLLDFQIPSLIIQPYIENSIWHGMMHKKEKGMINIVFRTEGHILVCTIEDNGIGRQKSMEINAGKTKTHESLGTKITKTRLELINALYSNNMNVRYFDKTDSDGRPTGTIVEIFIPVNS